MRGRGRIAGAKRRLKESAESKDGAQLGNVGALLSVDEDKLGGWQSGLLWRDGTRKPSYDVFKAAIAEVRRRDTDCSKIRGAPQD